jgi:hypothetical protein
MGQSHVAWGQAVIEPLAQAPEDRRRAITIQAEIEGRLVACGGVTGQGIESHWLAFHHKFHQLLYGEIETTDRMGKLLAECPELPWEMRLELAHQMWDEARHIEIVAKACEDKLGATSRASRSTSLSSSPESAGRAAYAASSACCPTRPAWAASSS